MGRETEQVVDLLCQKKIYGEVSEQSRPDVILVDFQNDQPEASIIHVNSLSICIAIISLYACYSLYLFLYQFYQLVFVANDKRDLISFNLNSKLVIYYDLF